MSLSTKVPPGIPVILPSCEVAFHVCNHRFTLLCKLYQWFKWILNVCSHIHIQECLLYEGDIPGFVLFPSVSNLLKFLFVLFLVVQLVKCCKCRFINCNMYIYFGRSIYNSLIQSNVLNFWIIVLCKVISK